MESDQVILWNRLKQCLRFKPKHKSFEESKFWQGWQYEWVRLIKRLLVTVRIATNKSQDQYSAKVGAAVLQGACPSPQPDFITSGMATLEAQFASLDGYQKCYFANQPDGPLPKDNIWWSDLNLASFPARSV